ncbi:MAG: hypothetical protein IKI37_03030, partial [Oscillospiraceae bacterium]|nr:hypothetical protein [Oscillospiraceae bacterium]
MHFSHNIYQRMLLLSMFSVFGGMLLITNLAFQMKDTAYLKTALHQSQLTITAGSAEGGIYDRNFHNFVNQKMLYYAVVKPSPEAVQELFPHVQEMTPLLEALRTGKPCTCQVDCNQFQASDIHVLEVPQRYSETPSAQHLLGYTLEHTGITALEADYNSILRQKTDTASVTYTIDALGHILEGAEIQVSPIQYLNNGIVTTLDSHIQTICEEQAISKGAVVVMSVQT